MESAEVRDVLAVMGVACHTRASVTSVTHQPKLIPSPFDSPDASVDPMPSCLSTSASFSLRAAWARCRARFPAPSRHSSAQDSVRRTGAPIRASDVGGRPSGGLEVQGALSVDRGKVGLQID